MATAVVVLLVGCGTVDGFPCETPGASQCDGPDIAFCEGTKWNTYACPSGCSPLKDGLCDWRGVKDGAQCPRAVAGDGYCPADGRMTACGLNSLDGKSYWFTADCPRCVKDAEPKSVLRDTGTGRLACE